MNEAVPPDVSIVIPVHNRRNLITRAIAGVQAQTVTAWELTVVDDHSTDGVGEVVAKLAREDGRIQVIKNEGRRGANAARNVGIGRSRAAWIALLDSDDEWLPGHLESLLEAAREFEARTGMKPGVVHSWYDVYCGDAPHHSIRSEAEGDVYARLLASFFGITSAIMISRVCIGRLGPFDPDFDGCQEYEMTLRAALEFPFACTRRPTVRVLRVAGERHEWDPRRLGEILDRHEARGLPLLGRQVWAMRRVYCGTQCRDAGCFASAARHYALALRASPACRWAWLLLLSLPYFAPKVIWRRRRRA
ncbi:glycosyltransferase family 2 protein [Candidatus Poribacteria bacterium]|nr:glycosyltransferase family 2 protein [Candidatus Poribacteria bacterium]